ncbi:MAG: S41 family peptidase [Dysgonomonas sp.]
MSKGHILYDTPSNGWRIHEGDAKINRTALYKNEVSLVISPDTLTRKSQVFFLLDSREVETNKIVFSGKYKAEAMNGTDGILIFSISRLDEVQKQTKDSIIIRLMPQDTVWTDFRVTSLIDKDNSEFINFGISSLNSTHFRISDCKVNINNQPLVQIINTEYGAEKDKEYDEGSQIELGEILTPQKIENIEVLGKVWGFLKYYHPEVVQGKYNWDYELFRVIPEIVNAKDKEERNKQLNKWIDKYRKIKETADYAITDSSQYSRIINLDWINDEGIFDEKMIEKLNTIKNAKRSNKFNYYVVPYKKTFSDGIFKRERAYENIKWNDQGFRLLTLFRLWNVIEYCFPYTEMTDIPWDILLKDFIPNFYNPKSKTAYELSILELAAKIDDSHGNIYIPNDSLRETILTSFFNQHRVPVELTQTKGGDIVVKSTKTTELQRGDVILSINSVPILNVAEKLRPYIASSNETSFMSKISPYLLSSCTPSLKVSILRNQREEHIILQQFCPNQKEEGTRSWKEYNLTAKKIGYINVATVDINEISEIITNGENSKGIILDMRTYPQISIMQILTPLLLPKPEDFIWFSTNNRKSVGNYTYMSNPKIGTYNPNYYKGKVAIIVNKNTISHGEFTSMAYRKAPNSKIIGSRTAGADGNITTINLPGAISFTYTALGAYYPNWENCQRKGVKIDIPALPTIQDIKEGKDVWIERAIEYINE